MEHSMSTLSKPSLLALAAIALLAVGCNTVAREVYDKDLAALKGQADTLETQKKAQFDAYSTEKARADAEKARAEKAGSELARTTKALNECTSRGGDASKNLAACQIERDRLRDRLGAVEGSIAKVRDALDAMVKAGKLRVKVARGFLIIELASDILFDTGKSKLKDEAKPVLRELVEVLKALPDRLFQVAGHTDNTGQESTNWKLSTDRALAVVQFLIADGGVEGKQLSAGGYAFYQPSGSNDTDEGRQKNRRVELLLIPNLSELLNLGK